MDRKNLLIVGGLISIALILIISIFVLIPIGTNVSSVIPNLSTNYSSEKNLTFDAKSPEEKAIFIARLNEGTDGFQEGFDSYVTADAHLSSDGKYWIVTMQNKNYGDSWTVTIDANTWMSKKNGSLGYMGITRPRLINTWRSFDELKAQYIAEIQISTDGGVGRPSKITMDGKEIWKVPIYYYHDSQKQIEYVYVDLATGKSKNTWNKFNKAAGTDGWLTLKEVDKTYDKLYGSQQMPFKDDLRDLYSG